MVQGLDKYRGLRFSGARRQLADLPARWLRLRQAPSPSIFAKTLESRKPVISPADRLLLDDVFGRMQLSAQAYRPAALGRRVPACLRALQSRCPAEAQRRLETDPRALDLALNALLIGVTAFFRDAGVFWHLRNTALPDLLRTAPAPRVLSVGCSDGAEAYSLAICLLELGVAEMTIRGIDCRRRAIDRARAGVFPLSSLTSFPPALRTKYFDTLPNTCRVREPLRSHVQWHLCDAFIHLPSPPYDLIACRNFAIYLEHPAARAPLATAPFRPAPGRTAPGRQGGKALRRLPASRPLPFQKGALMTPPAPSTLDLPAVPRYFNALRNRPPEWAVWLLSALLMGAVAFIHLIWMAGTPFGLSYALPQLICLWSRRRLLLYGMAVVASALSAYKTLYILGTPPGTSASLVWAMQLVNIWTVTFAVRVCMYAFGRLDLKRRRLLTANDELRESNEELASREEEVTQQNEELQSQTEELERQAEELRQQAEELEQQTVELHAANDELTRRERGLQTLLESARWLRSDLSERDVMSAVCQAAVQVMEEGVSAAAVVTEENGLLIMRGHYGFGVHGTLRQDVPFNSTFATLVMERNQTAYIADLGSRPDIAVPQPAAGRLFRSILATPLAVEGRIIGAVEVYAPQPREWTDGEFKVIEWLAAQCALALQAIEYQQEVQVKRREAEEASIQKTRFLAAVSHDVRTPANAISLMADLIEQSAASHNRSPDDGGPEIAGLARDLKANARTLVELVSDVLDLSRLDAGRHELQFSQFPLNALLKTAVRQFEHVAGEKKLRLTLEPFEPDVVLRTDKMKLARVLANLLGNAVKFTEVGAVEIRCRRRSADDGDHQTGVDICVSDTGVGIPKDALPRIFDEFYQLQNPERDRNKGAGLGLAICKRLVEVLACKLAVESTVGVGTTFTITLPGELVLPASALTDVERGTLLGDPILAADPLLRDIKVLLVEDHDVTRRATARLLATRGAAVLEARSGREALHLLVHEQPHVLLLDLMLPDADGTDILRHLRMHRPPSLKCVLAISGDVRDARLLEVKELGADNLLAKPLDIHMLIEAIASRVQMDGDNHPAHDI